MLELLTNIDSNILLFIQEHIRTPLLTPAVTLVTSLGNAGLIWIAASLLLLLSKKTRLYGYMGIAALLASLLVNNIFLKNIVKRLRPYDAIHGLVPLVQKPVDFSFPSGHTGSSFAAACVFYRQLPKKAGIPAVILAAAIGLSRLYVGVHYPTDVLAGTLTGIAASYMGEWAVNKLRQKLPFLR